MTKEHKGVIFHWRKCHILGSEVTELNGQTHLGFYIRGTFEDHPEFYGKTGHTSMVVSFDERPRHVRDERMFDIETLNSQYTLVGEETVPKPLDEALKAALEEG